MDPLLQFQGLNTNVFPELHPLSLLAKLAGMDESIGRTVSCLAARSSGTWN